MPVSPRGLERVSPDDPPFAQLKALVRIGYFRPLDTSENVRFTATAGARAMAAQRFELHERLRAVIPGDGKFITDHSDVRWKKALGHMLGRR